MTTKEITENIQYVINSLNTLTVSGKDNLNHLLGSMMLLEKIKASLNAKMLEQEASGTKEE